MKNEWVWSFTTVIHEVKNELSNMLLTLCFYREPDHRTNGHQITSSLRIERRRSSWEKSSAWTCTKTSVTWKMSGNSGQIRRLCWTGFVVKLAIVSKTMNSPWKKDEKGMIVQFHWLHWFFSVSSCLRLVCVSNTSDLCRKVRDEGWRKGSRGWRKTIVV